MKNPWLSMWLSAANAWTGAARGMATAETRRTQQAVVQEATKQMTEFWFPTTRRAAKPRATGTRRSRR